MLGYALAIGAAATWGLCYAIRAKLFDTYSPVFLMVASAVLTFMLLAPTFAYQTLQQDMRHMLDGRHWKELLAASVLTVLGNLCIYFAFARINPVAAGAIECAYPMFIVIFGYLLYKNQFLSWPLAIGFLLITAGVVVIISNRA